MSASNPSGKPTRDELLDHDADGIHEFDNALPRWWLYGFYFTILFALAYMVNYHVLPTPLIGKAGMIAEYEAEVQAAAKTAVPARAATAMAAAPLTDEASLAAGREIFEGPKNLCFTCHRADLGGAIGPNLTDDTWLHGCSIQEVMNDVRTGFPVKGMLPYGSGTKLTDEQLVQVVSYVFSRRGSHPANPKPPDPARDKECR